MLFVHACSFIIRSCDIHTHIKSMTASTMPAPWNPFFINFFPRPISSITPNNFLQPFHTHAMAHHGKAAIDRLNWFVCSSLEKLCDPLHDRIYHNWNVLLRVPSMALCWCSDLTNLYSSVILKNNDIVICLQKENPEKDPPIVLWY